MDINENSNKSRLRCITPEAFKATITSSTVTLIDVRSPLEFSEGHIARAINIDCYSERFQDLINGLDKTKPYALYCRSGSRSGAVLNFMANIGFTDVVDLDGGIIHWCQSGFKLE
jgi:rhodanese-related sulfurtransferase